MRGETLTNAGTRHFSRNFNPLSPCGERRVQGHSIYIRVTISIHSPHAGRDLLYSLHNYYYIVFQSTLPMRGETIFKEDNLLSDNISIHSPHAGRDLKVAQSITGEQVFQSTLPMRGETVNYITLALGIRFQSTLPMRGETLSHTRRRPGDLFQSTLPMRGETSMISFQSSFIGYFNPLSPCGERRLP